MHVYIYIYYNDIWNMDRSCPISLTTRVFSLLRCSFQGLFFFQVMFWTSSNVYLKGIVFMLKSFRSPSQSLDHPWNSKDFHGVATDQPLVAHLQKGFPTDSSVKTSRGNTKKWGSNLHATKEWRCSYLMAGVKKLPLPVRAYQKCATLTLTSQNPQKLEV